MASQPSAPPATIGKSQTPATAPEGVRDLNALSLKKLGPDRVPPSVERILACMTRPLLQTPQKIAPKLAARRMSRRLIGKSFSVKSTLVASVELFGGKALYSCAGRDHAPLAAARTASSSCSATTGFARTSVKNLASLPTLFASAVTSTVGTGGSSVAATFASSTPSSFGM